MMLKLKKSRPLSFMAVIAVYILAIFAGVQVYARMEIVWWQRLLASDTAATLVVFLFSVIFDNASVYDPYWSVQPPVILWLLAYGRRLSVYELALLAVVTLWAVRLTLNWAYTFRGLEWQDWRYTMLRRKTGSAYPIVNLVGIHLVPTLVVYACVLPPVYALGHSGRANFLSFVFLAMSLAAAALQGAADLQNHRFHARGGEGFLRDGLWKYSRHPNYLCEILMWWGVALSVLSVHPRSLWLCAGAAANTALFLFVSIPMADSHQSRKPGFDKYKSETRMLLPIKR